MKWKKLFLCLLACALLGLTACAKSGPEPVFSYLDTAQITSGEVHYWSSAAWAEMTQEDLNRIGPLLQEVEGTPQSGDQQQPYISASILPTFRLTLSDGSQWTITLYGLDDIDLIVTTSEGEAYYEVAQEQLNPILEIIQSYDLPDFTPDPQAQPELVCPNLDAGDVASGEVSNWSIGYQTPLTQEDLTQAVELLQPLEGLPLPDATPESLNGGVPTIQFTFTDSSQLTVTLYGRYGIDLIVTTPDGETCYDVEQSKLAPILEIIQSYDPPELPITPE